MGKKFLEIVVQGKKRRVFSEDFKAIYFYKKKRFPTVPAFISETETLDIKCTSPTDTDISIEDHLETVNQAFLG